MTLQQTYSDLLTVEYKIKENTRLMVTYNKLFKVYRVYYYDNSMSKKCTQMLCESEGETMDSVVGWVNQMLLYMETFIETVRKRDEQIFTCIKCEHDSNSIDEALDHARERHFCSFTKSANKE